MNYAEKYEQSLVRLFDPETGRETDTSITRVLETTDAQLIEEGAYLEQLRQSPGWKLLESFLLNQIEACTQTLVDLEDVEQIRRHQVFVRAYSNLLGVVAKAIEHGKFLAAQTQEPPAGDNSRT